MNNIEKEITNSVKIYMTRKDLTFEQLSQLLSAHGHEKISADGLRNKINRGKFSAEFLVRLMHVLKVQKFEPLFDGTKLEEIEFK